MKALEDLTRKEYVAILESGMFWVLYPEATGLYSEDCVDTKDWWANTKEYEIEVKIKVTGSTLEEAQTRANDLIDDINKLREESDV